MVLKSKIKNFINIKDLIENIDVNKIVVSNKVSFGKKKFKYFADYKEAEKLIFMHISPKNESILKELWWN